MDKNIESILVKFVNEVRRHFNLDFVDALAAVSESKVANRIVSTGDLEGHSPEKLCEQLFEEIASGY